MSAIIDALKKGRTKSAVTKNEQNDQIPKEIPVPASPKIIVFAAILIFGIALAMLIFYSLNTNIKSMTKDSRLVEDRVWNLERNSKYLEENLKASNILLKDLTAGMASLEKRAASNEESTKKLLSEIEGINTAIKNLQNEYSSVSAQITGLKKTAE